MKMNPKTRVLHTSLKHISTYDENQVIIPDSIGIIVAQREDGYIVIESHIPCIGSSIIGDTSATPDTLSRLTRNQTIRIAKQCLKASKELIQHYERLKRLLGEGLEIDEPREVKATKWEEVPEVRQPVKISTHSLDKNRAKEGKKGVKLAKTPNKTPKTINLSKLQGMLGGDG